MSDLFLRSLFTWRSAIASKHGPHSSITRHVLLTLSLHMNERGESCFPSMDLLAEETALSRRAVVEHLQVAAKAGWIGKRDMRKPNSQGWRRVEYFAVIPKVVAAKFHDEQGDAPGAPASDATGGDAPGAPARRGARHAKGGAPERMNVVHPVHSSSSVSTSRGKGAAARRALRPDGFGISNNVRKWYAAKAYPDGLLEAHLEKFLISTDASGARYVDWDKALMNCVMDDWGDVRWRWLKSQGRPAAVPSGEWWSSGEGVRAKAAELNVEHTDDPKLTPGENFMWYRAKVCAAAGEGPWCNVRDDTFQRFLTVARERMRVAA